MRVLQLIDSLHAGGAERMAVNLANALVVNIERSYLCATREEGLLKSTIKKEVNYLFLGKKTTLDIKVILRFSKFIKRERINIIHAHSSSYFLAFLIKLFVPETKIVWHDHYGNSNFLSERPKRMLNFCSKYFSHSFAVNQELTSWASKYLKHKSVSFLPNFIDMQETNCQQNILKGVKGYRIVCLANLRPQKDHKNLLKAFCRLVVDFPNYTLHCVGKDFKDSYSNEINLLCKELGLMNSVFFYGSSGEISSILLDCDLGVLSSRSEGLPLALLEYGRAALPVVVTDVGDCASVVQNEMSGVVVKPQDSNAFYMGLKSLLDDRRKAKEYGAALKQTIFEKYSTSNAINIVVEQYNLL